MATDGAALAGDLGVVRTSAESALTDAVGTGPSVAGDEEPHLPYSKQERAAFRLRFERAQRRQVAATIVVLLLMLMPFEFFAKSAATVLLALGLLLGSYTLFATINWRCPGCGRFLGTGYGLRFCPGCRLQFR